MYTIIAGTNREGSVTSLISSIYQEILQQKGVQANILDLRELPRDFIFTALYEQCGKNETFNSYVEMVNRSEKFVFVVPEYNGSFPGILKAFIDGLEYQKSFKNKKCALVGLSAGNQGGGLALSHLTDILHYLGMHVLALKPKLAQIKGHLTENNEISNRLYRHLLEEQAEALIQF